MVHNDEEGKDYCTGFAFEGEFVADFPYCLDGDASEVTIEADMPCEVVRFIRENRSMLAALQKKDWKAFARLYNGPAYAQNRYDEKLSTAYSSFKNSAEKLNFWHEMPLFRKIMADCRGKCYLCSQRLLLFKNEAGTKVIKEILSWQYQLQTYQY